MRRGSLHGYRYCRAGTHPIAKERGARMYLDFDNGLARERAAQMRAEVARNRLEARSAKVGRIGEDGGIPRGRVARGFVARASTLFGAYSAS